MVREAWKQVIARGYEGYVAKDERSVALPPRACSAARVGFMSWSKVGMTTMRFV